MFSAIPGDSIEETNGMNWYTLQRLPILPNNKLVED